MPFLVLSMSVSLKLGFLSSLVLTIQFFQHRYLFQKSEHRTDLSLPMLILGRSLASMRNSAEKMFAKQEQTSMAFSASIRDRWR
jgi:hypothetical protein